MTRLFSATSGRVKVDIVEGTHYCPHRVERMCRITILEARSHVLCGELEMDDLGDLAIVVAQVLEWNSANKEAGSVSV